MYFLSKKKQVIWVVSAYCRESQSVVRFSVGPRTNKTLRQVLTSLELAAAKKIYTDGLKHYRYLLNRKVHCSKRYTNNHVERMHLNYRIHLKRFQRRGLGFSRSKAMLAATLKLYLWG